MQRFDTMPGPLRKRLLVLLVCLLLLIGACANAPRPSPLKIVAIMTHYTNTSARIPVGANGAVTVSCRSGEQMLSGGYGVDAFESANVTSSYPSGPNSWTVSNINTASPGWIVLSVSVNCLRASVSLGMHIVHETVNTSNETAQSTTAPSRPYGATVWGDSTIYAEFFSQDGKSGSIDSITVVGDKFRQMVSRDDDMEPVAVAFERQLPWFTQQGQRALGRIRVGIVGCGGTGSQLAQNLVFLGIRDFVLVDDDEADDTSMNRLVTATAADIGTPKTILARRLIKSVAPGATVTVIGTDVQSQNALDALKGVDILFGCVDNDGARLILNEIALAYRIPYFDLAVGIETDNGTVTVAGGRVTAVLPGGPCLHCMKQIDAEEARFFLSDVAEQARQIARGYIRGMNVKAPSVVSLNATIAAVATNEFAVYVSGLRPVNVHSDIDILGVGRPFKAQWVTPIRAGADPACVQCTLAGVGDGGCIERYSHAPT